MENSEPNKIVSALYKRFKANQLTEDDSYYLEQKHLRNEAYNITKCVGAISVMSKNNILRLVDMQSTLRFMEHHTFYIYLSEGAK